MRKFLGLFFTLSILFFCSNIIFAEPVFPTTGTSVTVGVVADFDSCGEASFSIELRNISDDKEATGIEWLVQDINLNQQSDQWKWSTTYAIIKSTVTDPKVNYYLYQKNTESTVYKSTAPRTNGDGSKVYSGLVNQKTQGGNYNGYVPLSFLFTAEKLSSSELDKNYDPKKYDPGEPGFSGDDKVSRYFTDKADKDKDGEPKFDLQYAVIACADSGGIAFYPYDGSGYNPWSPESVQQSKTAYMYFGGNFVDVFLDDIFGTDQIFIEKVIE